MTTARDIITRALRKGKIIARRQTPTAEEINDGLADLNSMLGLWSNDSLLINARTLEPFSLTSGVSEYTIGQGADFNTVRPLFIVSAYIRDAGFDYKVDVISENSLAGIFNKNESGIPSALSYDNGFPIAKIKLAQLPSSPYQLWLLTEKQLTEMPSLDSDVIMPPGWDDVLVHNLAVRLCAEYGRTPDELTYKTANDGLALIQRTTNRNRNTDWGNKQGNSGNIMTGWWN